MKNVFSILLLNLLLVNCALIRPTPGKEKEAEVGYSASKPVIEALEKYRRQNNIYPAHLRQLVPTYIDHVDKELTYKRESLSYALGFLYTGRGISSCEYRPNQSWNCQTKY